MCKFSIIVPCYNAEAYVPKLCEMLYTEEYRDYEVILVDDCSKDETYRLLCEYGQKYSNFHAYQMPQNGGPGPTRNYGIAVANGENILFCDSDDEFDITCLSVMDRFLVEHPDADIVVFPHEIIRGKKRTLNDTYRQYANGEEVKICDVVRGCGGPVAKIYKKTIIQEHGIEFPARMTGEDLCFLVNYSVYVKKAYKSDLLYYGYIMNRQSITHQHGSKKNLLKQTTFELLYPIYHEHFPGIEVERFVNSHLLTKAKQMAAAKCSMREIKRFYQVENLRYPQWIYSVEYAQQSLYKKAIYKAMYLNRPFLIKFLMFVRKLMY